MSLKQGLGFQIKEAYPTTFCKCMAFIAWYHIVDSIMLNILKDPKKISHTFSTVWIPILE